MRGDDDEEEESSVNATRYPCMPSLVALQQMRNRLHLAHLGKKLMKWTAMATGRELRRLACEIDETYKNFAEDMRSAFMLLARGRYFYPHLNNIVLENVELNASVLVSTSTKAISGVKVLQLEVIESGIEPYEHLGIEKGGQTINVAKIAWRNLLKRLIMMLQQRTSFYQLELAHKSATKKMNVLGKIVIPRTKMSIRYIINELEEMAREDFYRLKKILEVKRRKLKGDDEDIVITCPICSEAKNQEEIAKAKCIICGVLLKSGKSKETLLSKDKTEDSKLEEFKAHIKEILDISKDIEDQGILSESVEEFLKTAEILQEKLENKGDIIGPIPSDIDIKQLCKKCKQRFDEEQVAKLETKDSGEKELDLEPIVGLPTAIPEIEPIQTPATPPVPELCELHSQSPVEINLDLGTFETEIQEITKIVRIKNEDGTITEEKKVVKIKREVKAPVKMPSAARSNPNRVLYQPSDESSISNPYTGKNTVGMMTIESNKCITSKKSICTNIDLEMNTDSSTMTNDSLVFKHSLGTTRYSISDIDFKQKLNYDSKKESVFNIHCCFSSEEEFKSILSYTDHTIESSKEDRQISNHYSYLTLSEMQLLAKILETMPDVRTSKSVNNVVAGKLRQIGRTVSFSFDMRYFSALPVFDIYRTT